MIFLGSALRPSWLKLSVMGGGGGGGYPIDSDTHAHLTKS